MEAASLPDCLEITARTADGVIMGIEHRHWPVIGLQFHPESVLTDCGFELLAAFLRRAGLALPATMPSIASERRDKSREERLPIEPVTF